MRPVVAIFLFTLLASSCATILNGPYTDVRMVLPVGTKVAVRNENGVTDTIGQSWHNEAFVVAKRSPDPLPVTVFNDSIQRTLMIRSRYSAAYYWNVYPSFGLGFIIDQSTHKRFTYPSRVFVDMNEAGTDFVYPASRWRKAHTGDLQLVLQLPIMNVWAYDLQRMQPLLNPAGSPWGIGAGLNKYYGNHTFWTIEGGISSAGQRVLRGYRHFTPGVILAPAQFTWGWYANVRNHHRLGRWDIGYGLSGGRRSGELIYWHVTDSSFNAPADSTRLRQQMVSLGGSAALNVLLGPVVCLGLNYQPQVLAIAGGARWQYDHMVVFGLSLRLGLNEGRKYRPSGISSGK